MSLVYAVASDAGRVRENNEDAALVGAYGSLGHRAPMKTRPTTLRRFSISGPSDRVCERPLGSPVVGLEKTTTI